MTHGVKIPLRAYSRIHENSYRVWFEAHVLKVQSINKSQFIKHLTDRRLSYSAAEGIWNRALSEKGSPFICYTSNLRKGGAKFIAPTSIKKFSEHYAILPYDKVKLVRTMADFRQMLAWCEAGRKRYYDGDVRKPGVFREEFQRSFKSITLDGLAKQMGFADKSVMCKILKEAFARFGGKITGRWKQVDKYILRMSSLYHTGLAYKKNRYSFQKAKGAFLPRIKGVSDDVKSITVPVGLQSHWYESKVTDRDVKLPYLPSELYQFFYGRAFEKTSVVGPMYKYSF